MCDLSQFHNIGFIIPYPARSWTLQYMICPQDSWGVNLYEFCFARTVNDSLKSRRGPASLIQRLDNYQNVRYTRYTHRGRRGRDARRSLQSKDSSEQREGFNALLKTKNGDNNYGYIGIQSMAEYSADVCQEISPARNRAPALYNVGRESAEDALLNVLGCPE